MNFVEYWERDINGNEKYHNAWVTDIEVTKENVYSIVRGGRARWKIENETFNTLKNQGYQFEHNFGHGENYLSTVFAMLMMLAFLIDQAQQMSCGLSQAAWKKCGVKITLWDKLRSAFLWFKIDSWTTLYMGIIHGIKSQRFTPDTS